MRNILVLGGALAIAVLPAGATAQSTSDSAGVVATARDYIEGWYQGDGTRMARALHPELVKRLHVRDSVSGRWMVDNQGASRLTLGTVRGGGSRTPKEKQRTDVTVLDVFRNAAVARVDADGWVDYLQLVREGDHWLILNVLWEMRTS